MRHYKHCKSGCYCRMQALIVGIERTDVEKANEVLERPNRVNGGYGMKMGS